MITKLPTKPSRRGPVPLLSDEECLQIAAAYDGRTTTIDLLLQRWRRRHPTLRRHNILQAARRGGYVSGNLRRRWSRRDDAFLAKHAHTLSIDEIASRLERTSDAVNVRRKRLGIGRYDGMELPINTLRRLTKVDHRQWSKVIALGWLKVRRRERSKGAAAFVYTTVHGVHRLLRQHPEVFDYRRASAEARTALALDRLPEPPGWKRVVCRSTARRGGRTAGAQETRRTGRDPEPNRVGSPQSSCLDLGGVAFWATLYAHPVCPRCGCLVHRLSEDAMFSNVDPGKGEGICSPAPKGKRGGLRADTSSEGVERRRRSGTGRRRMPRLAGFESLMGSDLALASDSTPADANVLVNILALPWSADDEAALRAFLHEGSLATHESSLDRRRALAMMAMTRIAGRHLLLVDALTRGRHWAERLMAIAPCVSVQRHHGPSKIAVRVFDRADRLRCEIDIFSLATRAPLSGPWTVACIDDGGGAEDCGGGRNRAPKRHGRQRLGVERAADGRGGRRARPTSRDAQACESFGVRDRVSAQVNPWLAALGWSRGGCLKDSG